MHALHRVLPQWQRLAASTVTPLLSVLLKLHSSERPLPVLARLSWSAMEVARAWAHLVTYQDRRLPILLGDDWGDTQLTLPAGSWTNELTGDKVEGGTARLVDLLKRFPVALLSRSEG